MRWMPIATLDSTPAALGEQARDEVDLADEAMVAGCVRGDRRAMACLYNRYKRRVHGLALRMVGPQEAEELTQDVFLRIYNGLSRFRGDSALGTWVYRITMNVCLSHLAKRRRRTRLDQDFQREAALELRPRESSPLLRRRLEQALARLPDGYRAVLVLHDVEGLNHDEVAGILGCRVGTSKSQLHKARMKMRALLEPLLDQPAQAEPTETSNQ